jgi:hypothetical protein
VMSGNPGHQIKSHRTRQPVRRLEDVEVCVRGQASNSFDQRMAQVPERVMVDFAGRSDLDPVNAAQRPEILEMRLAGAVEPRDYGNVVAQTHKLSGKIEKKPVGTTESANSRWIEWVVGQREKQDAH